MPDGAELGQRFEPLKRGVLAPDDPLEGLGGEDVDGDRQLGVARRVDDRVDVAVAARAGTSSAVRPDRRLTTPPGTSETPRTSPRSSPGSGECSGRSRRRCCRRRAGRRSRRRPAPAGRRPARQRPRRSALGRERQERRGDRVHVPSTACKLVGPARVVHQRVDGLAQRRRRTRRRARLQRLGGPVQDLAAVVGGLLRPPGLRLACGLDRVAHVLARAARDVDPVADDVVPSGLRAHERAADVQLVGLGDRDAQSLTPPASRTGAGPPRRPRGRSRSP